MGSSRPDALAEMMRLSAFGQRPFNATLWCRRQRGADVWVWSEDRRAYHAKIPVVAPKRKAWNKGRIIGQKRPLLPKQVWATCRSPI